MAANYVQVPPASTGLKIDTSEVTVGANTVERQNVCLAENGKAVYAACATAFSAGTGATTDIFTLSGSATTKVRLLKVIISSTTSTAASYYDYILALRSAAPTAGTSASPTVVPLNSGYAAGTAVAKNWTAAPTAGAAVGNIASMKYFSPITGTPASFTPGPLVFEFGNGLVPFVTLNAVAEQLAITINGVTPANAQSHDITVIWMEE